MWPSTVVGKSPGQPALLFQREQEQTVSLKQRGGINRSIKSLKEEKHDKTKTAGQSKV